MNTTKKRRAGRLALAAALALAALPAAAFGRHGLSANYAKPAGLNLKAASLADGSYEGEATGYGPGLRVSVTVKNGAVASVVVTSHNEVDRRFYDYPIRVIPAEIVKRQSTALDAVSGATATSYGIMAAVENALAGAR